MKKIFILLCLLYACSSIFAGRYAGDFMAIGAGVRALGLGGAFTAVADNGSAIYWNPAGIAQIREAETSFMRAFMYDGLAYYDNFTFTYPMPNEVTMGFSFTRLTIENIPFFDELHLVGTNIDQRTAAQDLQLTAIPDGQFNSTDDLFQFAFAQHYRHVFDLGWNLYELPIDFYLGADFKMIRRSMMGFTGSGLGFDLAMLLKASMGKVLDTSNLGDLKIGLNLQDIANTKITWDTSSRNVDEVLFNTKVGFSYNQPITSLNSNIIYAYTKDYVYDKPEYHGLAWQYKDFSELRFGLYDGDFCAGIGLTMFKLGVDYAFLTNNLGNTNRIGLSYRF